MATQQQPLSFDAHEPVNMAAATPSVLPSHDDPRNMREIVEDVESQFEDFDDPKTYEGLMKHALDEATENFAVRFGVEKAEIAINLQEKNLGALLQIQAELEKEDNVTWINIWSPTKNPRIIRSLADKYKFSTRLTATILGWDEAREQVDEFTQKTTTLKHSRADVRSELRKRKNAALKSPDLEKGVANRQPETHRPSRPVLHREDLNMYRLLQEQYNYNTFDRGSSFVCIGANWLHERPGLNGFEDGDSSLEPVELVPPKHWAWYILTNEGTVISIHEMPHYNVPKTKEIDAGAWKAQELKNMRKNTLDLLTQLSNPGTKSYDNRVASRKGVRSDLRKHDYRGLIPTARWTGMEASPVVDASANLFFYLFEDYNAATAILSKSHDILEKLTEEVLRITDRKNKDKDTSIIIKTLYARGKDLRQLKHLFESYEKLINKITSLEIDTSNSIEERESAAAHSSTSLPSITMGARGVTLSQSAYDRFDRLNVRLRLLMLDTIDEYLAEKTSLGDTYFNLMAQRDSQATAKLNRSASLLAKLSVFFLPISFMTSYFSVEIPDLTDHYTGTTYWVSFAVIATLSFLSLFFFSRFLMVISDALDEKIQSFQRMVVRSGGKAVGVVMRKEGAEKVGEDKDGDSGREKGAEYD